MKSKPLSYFKHQELMRKTHPMIKQFQENDDAALARFNEKYLHILDTKKWYERFACPDVDTFIGPMMIGWLIPLLISSAAHSDLPLWIYLGLIIFVLISSLLAARNRKNRAKKFQDLIDAKGPIQKHLEYYLHYRSPEMPFYDTADDLNQMQDMLTHLISHADKRNQIINIFTLWHNRQEDIYDGTFRAPQDISYTLQDLIQIAAYWEDQSDRVREIFCQQSNSLIQDLSKADTLQKMLQH